jgi:hypothetical protein
MPDWFDTPAELLTIITIGSIAMAVLFFVIDARVSKMTREFKPNGGSSLRDAIDRIERKQDRIEAKIDDHVQWHLEHSTGERHTRRDD